MDNTHTHTLVNIYVYFNSYLTPVLSSYVFDLSLSLVAVRSASLRNFNSGSMYKTFDSS